MRNSIVFACVTFCLVSIAPAAWGADSEPVTEYGAPAEFNGQNPRVFFTHAGPEVLSLGVEVPAAMYDGAPMDPPSDGQYDVPVDAADPARGMAWYCCGYEVVMELPESARSLTAFRHVVLNWNPRGHVPPGVYTAAHTDFHFYFTSSAERRTIGRAGDAKEMCSIPNPVGSEPPTVPVPQTCEQFAVTTAALPDDQMAPGYQNVGATEPAMGNHLLDLASHEFHGQAFDHTFIYMADAGRLTGMEPMISLEFLRSLQEPVRVPISMPAAFPTAGVYPTEYLVEYDRANGMFRVSYEAWKPFPASGTLTAGIDPAR
jgi:hypothetical protein